jgi:GT2 family glycosyltransferase
MRSIEFRPCANPRVSILVLAWRQHALLESCLRALTESVGGTIAYEVIVVLNGATPDVEAFLRSKVRGARVVVSQVNLGFSGGNNLAASVARGEYLALLNDDTTVEAGWLEWLVATADGNPRAGAVGSCILFPDGRIQEAGSIIWSDGSTMPVARGLPGDALTWHFVRRADYVSACSLLVRRASWDAVGGLDAGYFPAYYEDVDLCLALHARGEAVLYEPRSRVRHHESASSDSGFKRFLFARNRRRLFDKWRDALSTRETAAPASPYAATRAIWRARGCPRRILVVDDLVPTRSMGAGFGRMFDALVELSDQGYAAAIHPTWKADLPNDALISKGITIVAENLEQHLSRPDVFYEAVIMSRPHNFRKLAGLVRRHQRQAVLFYDAEALYWRRLERQAALAATEVEAARLRAEAGHVRRIEEGIFRGADRAVAVSFEEAAVIRGLEGACPVDVLPPSEPNVILTRRSFADRRDCAYVAGWLAGPRSPNADGLRWFVADVLPLLLARLPWARLRVTGANPPAEMRAMASANVRFEGHVDDLAELYDRVRVVISPIRYGAGVKLKTVEALQHGVPIVSTTVGAEGIDTRGIAAIDIADDPEQFADRLAALLTDERAWRAQREAIERLVQPWQRPCRDDTWTGVLETALTRQRRADQPIFLQH